MKASTTAFGLLVLVVACAAGPAENAARDLDPVRVAPEIYATRLENEHVRVIETTARPGEFTPLHSHPGRVAVFLNDCVDRRTNDKGEWTTRKFKAGEAVWAPAETHGNFAYTFAEECRILEVEVKGAG